MTARGSSAWRVAEWGAPCDRSRLVRAYWIAGAGKIECHPRAVSAYRALGRIMQRHHYHVRTVVTGCYNCRKVTGGTTMSAHAFGLALDVNWDTNPYRLDRLVTDMPPAMVLEIQALHTEDMQGPVFRWGGAFESSKDAMHFEIMLTPAELTGSAGVMSGGFSVPAPTVGNPSTYPVIAHGEHGPAVEVLQRAIGTKPDGIFGPRTEIALQDYQLARKLVADGVVGLATWTAVLTKMPALGGNDSPPSKLPPPVLV